MSLTPTYNILLEKGETKMEDQEKYILHKILTAFVKTAAKGDIGVNQVIDQGSSNNTTHNIYAPI